MDLLGFLLYAYFILLMTRLLIPDTGQMAFNQPYRLVVKLTDPVIAFSGRFLPPRSRRLAALPVIGLLILLHGVILRGETGSRTGTFTLGFIDWDFATARPFWGLGAVLAHYLVLSYRIFAFLLLIVLISPEIASDQVSRLIRSLVQPLIRAARSRWGAAVLLPASFTVAIAGLQRLYLAMGWLTGDGVFIGRTLINSLVLPLPLITVIIYLIIFQAVLSWFDGGRGAAGPFSWLEFFVEPFLRPLRRFNLVLGRIDLTPLAAIFALVIFRRLAERILSEIYRAL
jgi:uncharacterized protein YggT (Ycf19 family)